MPSFDVVSEMDMHEVRNAVDQAVRELGTRFDFRGVDAKIELEEESILLTAPEEFQIGQLKDILRGKMASRNVDSRALVPGDVEGAGQGKASALHHGSRFRQGQCTLGYQGAERLQAEDSKSD
jgi:uncharacterized protein YajQ (UPF0234 family)